MPTRSRSRKSKKVLLPKPRKGALGNYTTKKSAKSRRKSLRKDVKKLGYATTVRDLNIRAVMTKNKAPTASRKMRSDMEYLRKTRPKKSVRARK